jgi:ATP-dependent protease HslVU (ClpYQ) peptidase subunit
MTICLAVLCDESQKAVIAADRMITAGDTEFEQDARKVHQVTSGCVVLSAGSALRQVQLIRDVRTELHSRRSPSVGDVVTKL